MKVHLPEKGFSLFDLIPIVFSIIVCTVFFLLFSRSERSEFAVIQTESETRTVSLANDSVFKITSGKYQYEIEIDNGSISVVSADCPDHTCVNMGKIGKEKNGAIICPPGKLIIKIADRTEENDADIILP